MRSFKETEVHLHGLYYSSKKECKKHVRLLELAEVLLPRDCHLPRDLVLISLSPQ